MKQYLMSKVGFLKWAEVHPDQVAQLTMATGHGERLFISPDVHRFCLLWVFGDESIQYEFVDYVEYDSLEAALDNEAFDDAWESFDSGGAKVAIELMNDFGDEYSISSPPPVMRLETGN